MTFRQRLAAAVALAVALSVTAAASVAYLALRAQSRAEIDRSLTDRLADFRRQVTITEPFGSVQFPPPPVGSAGGYAQLVSSRGEVALPADGTVTLPVDRKVLAVAAGRAPGFMRDVEVDGLHLRVMTARATPEREVAIMIARALEETDQALRRIGLLLTLIALAGIAGAAGLGFAVARAALRPVGRLTLAAEQITATGDLHHRLPSGEDELGRLGARFNEMLDALHASLDAQRALVADASHELRTPLTSLRTNIEVLARARALPAPERDAMLGDITAQIEGLSRLVNDLIDLARGAEPDEHREDVRLDELVERAVEDARRNHPRAVFDLRAEPVVVFAAPARVERAVSNLIDNAAKYGASPVEPVEITVDAGGVTVRDHGPGFGDVDLPRIFDRFYRGATVRAVPGSGLGLAIAKQVADRHGWVLHAENADPGARISMQIPQG